MFPTSHFIPQYTCLEQKTWMYIFLIHFISIIVRDESGYPCIIPV